MNSFRSSPSRRRLTSFLQVRGHAKRSAVALLILAGLLAALVPIKSQAQLATGNNVYTTSTIPAGYDAALQSQQVGECGVRLVDLTVSVYRTVPEGALRDLYESNIRYAADAVYEMSNCAHKLRNITFYQNGAFADRANIKWVAQTHPSAHISGFSRSGRHIFHADVFPNNPGNELNFISPNSILNRRYGGYTLAHEMGHYFYSQFDEYRGGADLNADNPGSPAKTDDPVSLSVMHQQFNAASESNYAWLNFSTAVSDTTNTAQSRVYGASSWETLARPLEQDPRDGARASGPTRLYYPELVNYAPNTITITSPIRFDLPISAENYLDAADQPGNPARSALNFKWLDRPDALRMILVDVSQRLGENNRLETVREATRRLINEAQLGQDAVGLAVYSDAVRVLQAPTVLTAETRATLLAQVDTITATATDGAIVQDALQVALDQFALVPDNTQRQRDVFLLSTGRSTGGATTYAAVLPRYPASRTAAFTFGYGASDQEAGTLRAIAVNTDGKYTFVGQAPNAPRTGLGASQAPDDLEEFTKALLEANQDASPESEVELDEGGFDLAAGATVNTPILIDTTLRSLNVDVLQSATVSATLTLLAPNGTPSAAPTCDVEGNDSLCTFKVATPISGTWTLRAVAGAAPVEVDFFADGEAGATPSFDVEVELTTGEAISYPAPIIVNAIVSGPGASNEVLQIARATVMGTLTAVDGTTSSFSLRDDGVAPDSVPMDGQYSALLSDYPSNGDFVVQVEASNPNGTALATFDGYQPAAGPLDPITGLPLIPVPLPQPVRTNFARSDRAQVVISGVPAVGSNPAPVAITANNVETNGKIERAGDVARYQITVPARSNGAVFVRVADLAQGMRPRLRVLGPGGTVLVDKSLANPNETQYLFALVTAAPGTTLTAEVSHVDPAARGGLFVFSAGPRLAREGAAVFLPFVRR